MKSELNKGGTPEIYESPEILYKDIMMQGFLCQSGSIINDVEEEIDDIFDTNDDTVTL